MNQRLNSSWWALRIGLGVAPFLAGLDKFFNLLANWKVYLNPLRKESTMTQLGQVTESSIAHLEKVVYTARAHTTGGRDGGASRTDDGRLDVRFSSPGTEGTGTNPEQLFAVGWSACFLSAIKLVAGKKKVTLPADLAIDVEVDLGCLAARLSVSLPGIERQATQALVEAAHQVCPYSRATRGNINVAINVV
jgi:lipoyl-dependent peroxiredoxin